MHPFRELSTSFLLNHSVLVRLVYFLPFRWCSLASSAQTHQSSYRTWTQPSADSTSFSSILLEHTQGVHVYVDSLLFTSNDAQGLQSYLSRTSLLILSPVTSRNHKPSKCLSGRRFLKSHHTDTAQRESMSPSFTKVTLWGTHGFISTGGTAPSAPSAPDAICSSFTPVHKVGLGM